MERVLALAALTHSVAAGASDQYEKIDITVQIIVFIVLTFCVLLCILSLFVDRRLGPYN